MAILFTPNDKDTQPAISGFYLVKRYHHTNHAIEYSFYDGKFFRQPMPNIWQASDCRQGHVCPDVISWASMPS